MQRSAGMFYIIIILIYLLIEKKNNKLKKITLVFLHYLIICLILGFHYFKRAGVFYVMPTEAKYGVYKYFAKEILIKSNNLSITEVNKSEVKSSLIWIKNNLPQLDYNKRKR